MEASGFPIPDDHAPALEPASEVLAAVKQAEGADGSPLPDLAVQWKISGAERGMVPHLDRFCHG